MQDGTNLPIAGEDGGVRNVHAGVGHVAQVVSAFENHRCPPNKPCACACVQLTSAAIDTHMRDDLERLKKIRNHRGLRTYWGLRVRGQHTKTTGR